MLDALLRPKDAAELLAMPIAGLYRLSRANAIPVVRLGRLYRYDPDSLREWVRAGGVTSAQDKPASQEPPAELRAAPRQLRTRRQGA